MDLAVVQVPPMNSVCFKLACISQGRRPEFLSIEPIPRTKWFPLLDFVVTNSDLLSSPSAVDNTSDLREIADYLGSLTMSVQENLSRSSSQFRALSPFSQLDLTRRKTANDKALVELFIESTDIMRLCMTFNDLWTPEDKQGQAQPSVADHLRGLLMALPNEIIKYEEIQDHYYTQSKIYRFARVSDYESQISQLTARLDNHRFLIQTALALYLSWTAFDVAIDKRAALAFTLFPELHPKSNGRMHVAQDTTPSYEEQRQRARAVLLQRQRSIWDPKHPISFPGAERAPLYKFNPSAPPSGMPLPSTQVPTSELKRTDRARSRTSSLSSYATAPDTMSLVGSSLSYNRNYILDGVSLYSVASSRTAETDYGLYYTRMALSQTSIDSTRTEIGLRRSRSLTSYLTVA